MRLAQICGFQAVNGGHVIDYDSPFSGDVWSILEIAVLPLLLNFQVDTSIIQFTYR